MKELKNEKGNVILSHNTHYTHPIPLTINKNNNP